MSSSIGSAGPVSPVLPPSRDGLDVGGRGHGSGPRRLLDAETLRLTWSEPGDGDFLADLNDDVLGFGECPVAVAYDDRLGSGLGRSRGRRPRSLQGVPAGPMSPRLWAAFAVSNF